MRGLPRERSVPSVHGNPTAEDRGVRDRGQTFARHVVDDVEHMEAPAAGELVMHEIQRSARIRLCLHQYWRPRADGSSSRPTLAHRQSFLAVKTIDTVDPRCLALSLEQNEQASIA